MTSPTLRYRELVADLTAASRRHEAAVASAQSAYADGIAAIEHDLASAEEAVHQATAAVTRAQRSVAQTDLVASSLWDDLRALRRRIGPIPAPADASTLDAARLLDNAANRIERARRGGEPVPARSLPLLFAFGAVSATLLTTLAAFVAWPILIAAPLSGLPIARFWVDHRHSARLDPGGIGLVVLSGTLATAATWLTLASR